MKTETLEQYMERRKVVREELTGEDGDNDILVQYALGNVKGSTYPTMDKILEPGFMTKKQAI